MIIILQGIGMKLGTIEERALQDMGIIPLII